MRTSVRLAVAVLFVAAIAAAQVKESITVSYVELPVTVVDRGGNPIKGLTAANFEIVDEGQKRPIAGVDVIDFASPESVAGTSPLNPAARRNFLLVFDLTYSSPATIGRAQQAARDFVTKTVTRRDRVGVATVDVNRGYRLLTSFTTDSDLVDSAIANPTNFRGSDPLQLAKAVVVEETAMSMQTEGAMDAVARENLKDIMRGADRMDDQHARTRIERQMNLLAGLSKTLHAVTGQKHLVLLSEGFDPRVIQGRGPSQLTAGGGQSEAQQEAMAVESGQIWKVDNDDRYGSSTSMSLLDKMASIAKRSDVIIDAVDIRGLRSDSDASGGFSRSSNDGLHLLANSTGGTVFKNSNDLGSDFQRVIKSQEVVYVLAFNAPTKEPGKFHNVKVKLVNVPSGARVSGRSGYYEAGAETAAERNLSNAEIITNDIAQDAVHIAALVAPFPTSSANAQVPVILEINGSDLAAAAKNNAESMEVFVYAFDEEGLVRDSLYQRVGLDLARVGPQLRATGVKYYATLSLPAGKYAVKSLVRIPETEKKGFNRTDIVVPEQGDVAISSPFFFDVAGKWVMIKGGSHDKTNAPYPFEVNGTPFVPSAAVHVKSGEPRRFAVFIRNASPDEMTLATNPEAKVVDQLKSANGAKLVFELDKVAPQQSTLNVTMKKRGSEDQRTASIPISVQ